MMEQVKIQCPQCKVNINVPFMRELKAKAIEEADLSELTARDRLRGWELWLYSASLWDMLKLWRQYHK